ncbi:MAG: SDR family NAD(P)-dependent oxidoreductase [Bacteroidetes bacterium]|nr:SDR family NAD(P)-dependent oxidoreductase [Bacteroidota bacterium]MDA0888406.1 SDR family NAD(P)-dependent oxidoreductase [Bacteroidota bacterium]MDA1084466.1 SDR family NAD(P)-dependent oxidoreductase [Bacteroidota bacterium]
MGASKNIVITGASRGIGLAMTQWFSDNQHHVWVLSRNIAPIVALNAPNVHAFSLDISDDKALQKWSTSFAPKSVDVLINNAGKLVNKPFSETSQSDFESVYKVNVFGLANLTRILLPKMNSDSHIVNISSMGGLNGTSKFPGLAAYSSSKGAVSILTELLAEEFKETGPSVNALALGAVQTEMLSEAFPGLDVPMDAKTMAAYIAQFALTGHQFYNGKVLPVSNTTP